MLKVCYNYLVMVKIKKLSKKFVITFLFLLSALVVGIGLYLWLNSSGRNEQKPVSGASAPGVPIEQSGAANIKSPGSSTANQNVDPPKATGTIQNKTLTIDSFSQASGLVKASASITGADTGECYFGFASEGTKPVSRSVQSTGAGSSSQKCSVEINEVEFTKLGSWKLTVIFTQNDAKLEKSQDVTIN